MGGAHLRRLLGGGRLTPEQFARLAARTRLKERARAAARMVLVDGQNPSAVARATGYGRETVRAAAARVLREWRIETGAPAGWEVLTLALPVDAALEVREIEDRALRNAGLRI